MSGTSSNFTQTPNLGLFKPTYAADAGYWGTHLNANADKLDSAVLPASGGTLTGPLIWTATHSTTPRAAQDRSADVINVLDYVATGATDYAPGIQAALNAVPAAGATVLVPVMCPVGTTLFVPSNTLLRGCGPGTGFTCLSSFTVSPIVANKNNTATTLTDHDISIEDMTIDYGSATASGTHHVIALQFVSNVRITNCTLQVRGNGDATALLGCYNTHVHGCSAFDFVNCAYDHWTAPQQARVTNCYAQSAHSAQFVNFNPDPTSGSSSNVARGFLLSNCELVCTDTSANPCQIEPLRSGTSVLDVVITGNIFRNVVLSLRGNTRGAIITGNLFDTPLGGAETIKAYTMNGGTPTDFVVSNNNILDPATTSGNVGVIRIEATNATITGNRVSGTLYGATPGIYTGTGNAVVAGNSVSNGAYSVPNATGSDTAFKVPRLNALATTGLNVGSGVIADFGDTVTANTNNFLVSYTTGTASGAATLLGINTYYDASATLQRLNTAHNGWYLYHDNRSQTGTDGTLRLGVVSSAGVNTTTTTFNTDGSMAVGTGAATVNSGAGAPAATRPIGSIYMRTDGTAGARLYVSAGGGTWTAVAGV